MEQKVSTSHLVITAQIAEKKCKYVHAHSIQRFVRDHLRYSDSITCAAARVVEALRDHARNNNKHNASRVEGVFDAMHVRYECELCQFILQF